MDVAEDGRLVAASLAGRLDGLTFTELSTEEVTALLIDAVADWAAGQGWRVYRRASSVLPLPPPLRRQSVLDVACARPDGPPVVIEIDHTDRRRTVEKLVAEADAGRIAIWVRWGPGRFAAPPPPVHLVTCTVHRRQRPAGQSPCFDRSQPCDRPAPAHSAARTGTAAALELPIPLSTQETSQVITTMDKRVTAPGPQRHAKE